MTNAEEELSVYLELPNYDRLRIWDSPPKYRISEDLPKGFGIYLEGEDGISLSGGNDPNDINSWDRESASFYHARLHRSRALRDLGISGAIAGVVFLFCFQVTYIKKLTSERTPTQ